MGEPKIVINRKHERVPVRVPVRIKRQQSQEVAYDGEILNLSEGGAYIASTVSFAPGEELALELRFADVKWVSSRVVATDFAPTAPRQTEQSGVVRWQDEKTNNGFGVEFVACNEEQKVFLQTLLSYFLQLAKAGVSF